MKRTDDPKDKDIEDKIWMLESILESSIDAIITESFDGVITSWNKGAEKIYGYSAEEILGKSMSILEPSMLDGETEELIEFVKHGDIIQDYETLQLKKDYKMITVSLTLSPVFDSFKNLVSIVVIAKDITETKQTEEELRKSEERYRKIAERYRIATEQTGHVIYDYDLITDKCSWAGAIEEVTGYTFEEFQKLGKDVWIENVHSINIDCIDEEIQNSRMIGDRFKEELIFRRKDGTCVYVEHNGVCLKDNEGHLYRSVGVLKDITKQKETEATLASIETARKKEIHHRIKNNLQVISSLLDLQAEQFRNQENIKDSEVLEAFRESQDRVISMALIHEELHKGEGFEILNFSPYIQELAENLLLTYQIGTDVSLNIDLEDNIFFDMDTAVPLGIIVNELISNSLKHAFIGRNRGEIRINLCREKRELITGIEENIDEDCKSTSFTLTVSDNGVGIPENLEIEELDSLGLQLVASLVDQLDGKLELKRDNGTEFIIKFTVTENNNPVSVSAKCT